MKIRDTQRLKLHRASHEASQGHSSPLATTSDIQKYLERQSARKVLQRRYGNAVDVTGWALRVSDGRSRRSAGVFGTDEISIPRWARNDWLVLQLWAHIIHKRTCVDGVISSTSCDFLEMGSRSRELRGGAHHGWQYAAIFLDLVHFCIGEEAAVALKAAFKKHKVRYRPKKTRVATQEQLQRLAAMRAARTAPVAKAA